MEFISYSNFKFYMDTMDKIFTSYSIALDRCDFEMCKIFLTTIYQEGENAYEDISNEIDYFLNPEEDLFVSQEEVNKTIDLLENDLILLEKQRLIIIKNIVDMEQFEKSRKND